MEQGQGPVELFDGRNGLGVELAAAEEVLEGDAGVARGHFGRDAIEDSYNFV